MRNLVPLLMFDGRAREAIDLYTTLFRDGHIIAIAHYGDDDPENRGKVMHARIALDGREVICIDSAVRHDFGFTPALSLWIDCDDAAELDRLYDALAEGGRVFLPPGQYPFSPRYAWVADRFGVAWQLNVPV